MSYNLISGLRRPVILAAFLLLASIDAVAQWGVIDIPQPMQVLVGPLAYMQGWAVDFNTSISYASITVDGVYLGNANYGAYRPDVCAAVGNVSGCPYVGWTFYLNTTVIPDGPHVLTAQFVTTDSRQVTINRPFLVDNANAGLSYSTFYRIVNRESGKVLDVTGIDASEGALLQQYDYRNNPNQLVRFFATQSGSLQLQFMHSSKVLSASNGLGDTAPISQTTYGEFRKWVSLKPLVWSILAQPLRVKQPSLRLSKRDLPHQLS